MWFSSAARFRMVICRNENLIKHAAEVALNNLTVRGRMRGGRKRGMEGGGCRLVEGDVGWGKSSSLIFTLLLIVPLFFAFFMSSLPLFLPSFFSFSFSLLSCYPPQSFSFPPLFLHPFPYCFPSFVSFTLLFFFLILPPSSPLFLPFPLAFTLPLSWRFTLFPFRLSPTYDPAFFVMCLSGQYEHKQILIWRSLSLSNAFWEDN